MIVFIYMTDSNRSLSRKKHWAGLTKKEKLKRMQPLIKNRWKGTTKAERSEAARKAVTARWLREKQNDN